MKCPGHKIVANIFDHLERIEAETGIDVSDMLISFAPTPSHKVLGILEHSETGRKVYITTEGSAE
jgi:hypothetical protein